MILLSPGDRQVTLCNHNFSHEGVLHPDRVMDEYDLLYLQSGTWTICEEPCRNPGEDRGGAGPAGGVQTYELATGSVLLLRPGFHHFSRTVCSPEMRNVYLHFTALPGDGSEPDAGREEEPDRDGEEEPADRPRMLHIPSLQNGADNPQLLYLMERIVDAFWGPDHGRRQEKLSHLLSILLCELEENGSDAGGFQDPLITEIIHRMDCYPERFFCPEELAEDYGVCLRTMSARFKKATGESIHQFQLSRKLLMAYDTLPYYPGRGLREIAHSYGFYDEFQFCKLFKRKFGITPSQRRTGG